MGPTEINMKHQNTTNLFRKHGIDTSGLSSGLKGKQTIFTQLLEFQDKNPSQDPPVATPCRSSAVIPKARVMFSFFCLKNLTVFSSTTYTEQVEAGENDRMRLQQSLGLSVRPGFQIPLEVLQKTRRKRVENAAQLAIFKQIEDEIWNKNKRQQQQKAHTSSSAHAAKRQVGNTIMDINSMNKLCRPKMCLREREIYSILSFM